MTWLPVLFHIFSVFRFWALMRPTHQWIKTQFQTSFPFCFVYLRSALLFNDWNGGKKASMVPYVMLHKTKNLFLIVTHLFFLLVIETNSTRKRRKIFTPHCLQWQEVLYTATISISRKWDRNLLCWLETATREKHYDKNDKMNETVINSDRCWNE